MLADMISAMRPSGFLPILALVTVVQLIVPSMTAVHLSPSHYSDSRIAAPGSGGNWYNRPLNSGKASISSSYSSLPTWMFDDNAGGGYGADDDEPITNNGLAGDVAAGGYWGQQETVDGWEDQMKRSLASRFFARPARSRNSYQACSRRLLSILENACNGRAAKRSVNGNMLEPANWTAVAETKERPKRNLVDACCHNSCSKRELMSYCFYVL